MPCRVYALQEEVVEGPCLDAVFEQQTVRVSDMASEERWPRFASHAAEIGAKSMLSFQLYVEGDSLGALNLDGRQAGGVDEESEQVGLLFASHAAVAFADAQQIDRLREGVATRDLIGQAKGILAERHRLTADQDFRMLVTVSNDNNRLLRSVAVARASTGELSEDRT